MSTVEETPLAIKGVGLWLLFASLALSAALVLHGVMTSGQPMPQYEFVSVADERRYIVRGDRFTGETCWVSLEGRERCSSPENP